MNDDGYMELRRLNVLGTEFRCPVCGHGEFVKLRHRWFECHKCGATFEASPAQEGRKRIVTKG